MRFLRDVAVPVAHGAPDAVGHVAPAARDLLELVVGELVAFLLRQCEDLLGGLAGERLLTLLRRQVLKLIDSELQTAPMHPRWMQLLQRRYPSLQ